MTVHYIAQKEIGCKYFNSTFCVCNLGFYNNGIQIQEINNDPHNLDCLSMVYTIVATVGPSFKA